MLKSKRDALPILTALVLIAPELTPRDILAAGDPIIASPKCSDGRHFQCPGFWWKIQDHIALTCFCWCHERTKPH